MVKYRIKSVGKGPDSVPELEVSLEIDEGGNVDITMDGHYVVKITKEGKLLRYSNTHGLLEKDGRGRILLEDD